MIFFFFFPSIKRGQRSEIDGPGAFLIISFNQSSLFIQYHVAPANTKQLQQHWFESHKVFLLFFLEFKMYNVTSYSLFLSFFNCKTLSSK